MTLKALRRYLGLARRCIAMERKHPEGSEADAIIDYSDGVWRFLDSEERIIADAAVQRLLKEEIVEEERHPLRELVDRLGISQHTVATELGISDSTVSRIIRGIQPLTPEWKALMDLYIETRSAGPLTPDALADLRKQRPDVGRGHRFGDKPVPYSLPGLPQPPPPIPAPAISESEGSTSDEPENEPEDVNSDEVELAVPKRPATPPPRMVGQAFDDLIFNGMVTSTGDRPWVLSYVEKAQRDQAQLYGIEIVWAKTLLDAVENLKSDYPDIDLADVRHWVPRKVRFVQSITVVDLAK